MAKTQTQLNDFHFFHTVLQGSLILPMASVSFIRAWTLQEDRSNWILVLPLLTHVNVWFLKCKVKVWNYKIYQLPSSSESSIWFSVRTNDWNRNRTWESPGNWRGYIWQAGVVYSKRQGQVQTSNWSSLKGANQGISQFLSCPKLAEDGNNGLITGQHDEFVQINSSVYNSIVVYYSFAEWFSPCSFLWHYLAANKSL